MTHLICTDLETTGVDIKTCEVVQVGGVSVDTDENPSWAGSSKSMLCGTLHPIPASATEVHGITDEAVAGKPHFGAIAESVIDWLDTADIVVTFNGASFDLPIIGRHVTLERIWRPKKHIDVFRLWQYLRRLNTSKVVQGNAYSHVFTPALMTGSLSAAFAWCHGFTFDGAHDALADCQATLDVLQAVAGSVTHHTLLSGKPCVIANVKHEGVAWDLDHCVWLTAQPLPGDVDWSGKLRWDGDTVVFSFGKHKGRPVRGELGPRGYVSWMLSKGDFPEDTCKMLRAMTAGVFPKREQT